LDPRFAVRQRGLAEFAKRFASAGTFDGGVASEFSVAAGLGENRNAAANASYEENLIWVLSRIDSVAARSLVRQTLLKEGVSETTRHVALQSVSLWRDRDAVEPLLKLIQQGSPATQRLAAEALGRIGDKSAVAALLYAAGELERHPADAPASSRRILEHAITYALIELSDPAATAVGLASENRATRRAALIALDQMEGGRLIAEQVTPLLTSSDPVLRETAV
jgi:HEAT repeat protein